MDEGTIAAKLPSYVRFGKFPYMPMFVIVHWTGETTFHVFGESAAKLDKNHQILIWE